MNDYDIDVDVHIVDATSDLIVSGKIIRDTRTNKVIFHTGLTTRLLPNVSIQTNSSCIDDHVCDTLSSNFGVEQIFLFFNTFVDISPKYYDMITFELGCLYVLRDDTTFGKLKINENSTFIVDIRNCNSATFKIYELITYGYVGCRLAITDDKTLIDLLRDDRIKWSFMYDPTYGNLLCARVNHKMVFVSVDMCSDNIKKAWFQRICFNNIRQRDIPGFERIVIEAGLEHLL